MSDGVGAVLALALLAALSACGKPSGQAARQSVVLKGQEDSRTDAEGGIVTADELAENKDAVATPPSDQQTVDASPGAGQGGGLVKSSCIAAIGGGGQAYGTASGDGLSPGKLASVMAAAGDDVTWTGGPDDNVGVLRATYTDAVSNRPQSIGVQFSIVEARAKNVTGCGPQMTAIDRLNVNGIELDGFRKTMMVNRLAKMAQ